MDADDDTAHALAALSARVMALEGALAALAPRARDERALVLAAFDRFAQELLDRYIGLPIDEASLNLVRQSLDDVRALLESQGGREEG